MAIIVGVALRSDMMMQAPLKYIFSVGLISVVYEGLFIKKMVSSSPKITRFYIQAHKQRERNLRDTDWIEMSLFTASNGESALEVVLGKCQMSPSSSAGNCGSVVASQLSYKPYSNLFEFYSNLFPPTLSSVVTVVLSSDLQMGTNFCVSLTTNLNLNQ